VRHYKTMTLADLIALPVGGLAADDAWLFLWSTGPHLPQALFLMSQWGFSYSGIAFCWAKLNKRSPLLFYTPTSFHVGMGYTTRKNVELCLLGRRGHPKRLRNDVRELIVAPRREHSRKPDEFYDRLRAFAPGPYLDMFARQIRPGFDCWGDEVEKFNAA
jgi:N6-adenosine-specific RNA methylase IME4